MRFGFVTCVELGLACMQEIERVGGHLDLVITLPDDRSRSKSGRVYVDEFCSRHGASLVKVPNVNDAEAVEAVRSFDLDWLFIIGWSQIARAEVLAAPRRGVLGMHPTLLPEGRGRAAIPWAILKGLRETGVTLFQLDEGVDTGPILAQERLTIAPDETATTLYERVAGAHQRLLAATWPDLIADAVEPVPQEEAGATSWPGRTPADGRIAPTMSVAFVDRLVRATTRPYPGAFWEDQDGVLRVWSGAPLDPVVGPLPGTLKLELADGIYQVLEYEREPPSAPPSQPGQEPRTAGAR